MNKDILKSKIFELKEDFFEQYNEYRIKHLITRRIGSFHGYFFLCASVIVVCLELISVNFLEEYNTLCKYFSSIFFCLILIVMYLGRRIFFVKYSDDKKQKAKILELKTCLLLMNFVMVIIYLTFLAIFSTDILILVAGVSLLIYLGCYLTNKQHGYTRCMARNQRYYFLLESIEWEVEHLDIQDIDQNSILSELKLEELTSKFIRVAESQLLERQRDIIGDYLSTNDAGFSWIKSIKK